MPTANINNSNCAVDLHLSSGGERTRTADFHVANVALYQLSYTPGATGDGPSESSFGAPRPSPADDSG